MAVADPGGVPPARAPQGSRFFHFDIQIFRNVAASGVGAPLRGWRPLREILDPPLHGVKSQPFSQIRQNWQGI